MTAGAIASRTYANLPFGALDSVGATTNAYNGSGAEYSVDVAAIAQQWANSEPNLGFHLYQQSGTSIDTVRFGSFNNSDANLRPRHRNVAYAVSSLAPIPPMLV